MSHYGSHTHRAASVARHLLSFVHRIFTAGVLLAAPALASAGVLPPGSCELVPPPQTSFQARPNEIVSFSFQVQRSASNPSLPCTAINGNVNNEGDASFTVTSSGAGTTTEAPHAWIADENESITVQYDTGPAGTGSGQLYVYCNASSCDKGTRFIVNIEVVDRALEPLGEISRDSEPNANMFLEVRALDDNFAPNQPVQINWTVSGPATLETASSSSSMYADAGNRVFFQDSAPGASTVTVTATRADEPTASVTFTIALAVYELGISTPAPGTTVMAGDSVPLSATFTRDGVPVSGKLVEWSFDQNPNGSALQQPSTTTDSSGSTSNMLTVGSPNVGSPPPPILVRALVHAGSPVRPARAAGALLASTVFQLAPVDVITLTKLSGDNQSGTVGATLDPMVVGVTRNGTAGVGGVINWTVAPAGAATLASGQSTVDGQGNASIQVLHIDAPGPFTVTAAHNDDPSKTAVFDANGIASTLTLESPSGDGQTALVNQPIPQPLRIQALTNGSPQPGITINWSVSPAGFASVTPSTSTTDTSGFAETSVTNGPNGGAYSVIATRSDDPTVTHTFGLTAEQRDLIKPSDSGNAQFGATGSTLANPLVVVATRNGTPEAGVGVTWSVINGPASISNATSPTDNAGRSSVTVTLGSTPGTAVIRATRNDDGSIVEDYTVQAFSKMLTKPATGSGDGQSGAAGSTLPQPLVAVATLNGTPESGVAVNWAVLSGNASLSNITSPTDSAGRSSASVTLGTGTGPVVVRATRADVPSQFQDYTLAATDVRTLDKPNTGSGDGQNGPINTDLPQPLVVFARNNGAPATGVTVSWTASNGATVMPASSVTDSSGRAAVTVHLGPNPGAVNVTATRADATTANASFVLTATGATAPRVLSIEKPPGSGDGTELAPGERVTLSARTLINGVDDSDVAVFWEVVSGSAIVGAEQSLSNAEGIARTVITAGMTPGPVTIRATHGDGGGSVTYSLRVAGTTPGVSLFTVSGDDQTAAPGTRGADLVVRLTNGGAPVPDARVSWQVTQGTATLDEATTTTDANGNSANGISFGAATGAVLVQASANGVGITFHLMIDADRSVTLRLVSGNNQRGPVGTRADQPILVEVVDQNGAPVAGQPIDWAVVSGGATLDTLSTATDAGGRSSLGFRFGSSAGPVRIRASIGVADSQVALIDATGVQPTLAIVSGNNQTGAPGSTLPQDLVVQIAAPADAKSLAGVTVRWNVVDGGGTLASASSLTDASGRASNKYTLGSTAGAQHVRAAIDGGASVTFTETTSAPPGALVLVSGNSQTLPTRSPSAPLVVSLATTAGTPIQGAVLTWTASNAELQSVRTTTDAQGRASNVAEVLLPGEARITVLVEGVQDSSTVVFTLNGGVANIPQIGAPEETVANAIDSLCPALIALSNPTPEQADLRARCLELVNNAGDNPGQVDTALDELRQDVALAQANAAFVSAQTQFDNVKTRIAALRGGASGADFSGLAMMNSSGVMPLSFLPSAVVQDGDEGEGGGSSAEGQDLGSGFSKWGFFASGMIGRGSYDGSSLTPEYDYDSNGLTAGVDYRVNDQWIVGASLGWNQQDTELARGEGEVKTDGWSVSGYTTWYHEQQWYLDGVVTFGSNDYDLSRRIRYALPGTGGNTTVDQVARASTGGDQLSFAVSFGRDFQRGNLSFGPYLRGMYTRVDFDGYAETLNSGPGSGLGLAVDGRELESMTGVLGGKMTWALSRDWGILMPHAQLEWEHEFEDDPQQLAARFLHDPTRTTIRAEGDAVDTDFYNIGFGLSALLANGRSAFVYYEHLAGSEGLSQDNLSLGIRLEF